VQAKDAEVCGFFVQLSPRRWAYVIRKPGTDGFVGGRDERGAELAASWTDKCQPRI
jgi:hypothetical protein